MAKLLILLRFRLRLICLALKMAPIAGAEEPDDSEDTEDADAEEEEASEETDAEDDDKPKPPEVDWKRQARKHEREAKKARKEREAVEQRLKAREDADKSEQEKAIEEAENRARTDLESKFQKERRQDRLEVAATKIAAKGLKIGSGDDAKTVRFADPDDALLHLERDIRNGDLDEDDIFGSDGRVDSTKLEEALTDLLERKPHLAAGGGTGKPAKVTGSADGGKGAAPKDDTSVEGELAKIRRHKGERAQRARAA